MLKLDDLPTLEQFMNYCNTKDIFHKDINFIIFFIPIKYFKMGFVVGTLLFSYNLLFLFYKFFLLMSEENMKIYTFGLNVL